MADEDDSPRAAPVPVEPPVMPTHQEARSSAGEGRPRPPEVRYAFVVWVLAGLCGIANAAVMLANEQALVDEWVRANTQPSITPAQLANSASTLLWMFMVAAVLFALMFTLSAYKAQDAVRRARLTLTVLCLITVVFYAFVLPTLLGVLTGLLALAGTVLLYLPRANHFFRPGQLPT